MDQPCVTGGAWNIFYISALSPSSFPHRSGWPTEKYAPTNLRHSDGDVFQSLSGNRSSLYHGRAIQLVNYPVDVCVVRGRQAGWSVGLGISGMPGYGKTQSQLAQAGTQFGYHCWYYPDSNRNFVLFLARALRWLMSVIMIFHSD